MKCEKRKENRDLACDSHPSSRTYHTRSLKASWHHPRRSRDLWVLIDKDAELHSLFVFWMLSTLPWPFFLIMRMCKLFLGCLILRFLRVLEVEKNKTMTLTQVMKMVWESSIFLLQNEIVRQLFSTSWKWKSFFVLRVAGNKKVLHLPTSQE